MFKDIVYIIKNISKLKEVINWEIPSFPVAVGNPARVISNRLKLDLSRIDINTINQLSEEEFKTKEELIKKVLDYSPESEGIPATEERAFPGEKRFIESGYYKIMLKRYLFAGTALCIDSDVLDTCCGLGWGSYIVAHYAKQVTAVDIDKEVINLCMDTWEVPNVSWIQGDVLK